MTTKNEAIQFLTDANIIINAQNLVYYSQLGDLVKVEYLLLAGVDPNESSSEGYVAIVQAVAYNQKKIVHFDPYVIQLFPLNILDYLYVFFLASN